MSIRYVSNNTFGDHTQIFQGDHGDHSKLLPIAKDAAFDSFIEDKSARCLPGTRAELLEEIERWANDSRGKCIYWLNGAAGTGKSTISRTVAKLSSDRRLLGASFFFKRGEADRGNARLFVTTIASQLVSTKPVLGEYITAAVRTNPDLPHKALGTQFEELILQPLRQVDHDPCGPPLVLVIDALDECGEDVDVALIINLLSRAKDLARVRVRVFITSRPELPIRNGFSGIEGQHQSIALHRIPESMIWRDISIFLRHELRDIKTEYNRSVDEHRRVTSDWPSDSTVKRLIDVAFPLFIYAATICRFIRDRTHGRPDKLLTDVLETPNENSTSKPGEAYLPVLDRLLVRLEGLERQKVAQNLRDIVGPIALLADPLSTTVLSNLLGIDRSDVENKLDLLHSVLNIPSDPDSPVRLFHLSFRDFLVDQSTREEFRINERECHQRIADRCLKVMSQGCLKRDICNLRMPRKARKEAETETISTALPAHVQYACLHWVYHLKESRGHIQDGHQVDRFLRQHLLHWLEALCLMGKALESISMISTLQGLVRESDAAAGASSFFRDANRFVLNCISTIDKWPLQLYSSAIAFAPEESVTRTIFGKEALKLVNPLPRVNPAWGACIQTLHGHGDRVNSATFLRDSGYLVSASHDRSVRVWEMATGRCRWALKGHRDAVSLVTVSYNGLYIASASDDHTVKVWEMATGRCLYTLNEHGEGVSVVAFSFDDLYLASASWDNTVRIWETATGKCLQTLKGHVLAVSSVVFSPDGYRLASASWDSTVKVWNALTGTCLRTLKEHSDKVTSVAFSRDSACLRLASASRDGVVKVWETAMDWHMRTLQGHKRGNVIHVVIFSPDSRYLASASEDHTVRLWNVKTSACIRTLEGHNGEVRSVSFSHDSKSLASASEDHTIKVWEVITGTCLQTFEGHNGGVNSVAFSHDSARLASASKDHTIRIWEVATGKHGTPGARRHQIDLLAFSRDSAYLASTSSDGGVQIWDAKEGLCLRVLEGHIYPAEALTFSHDSAYLASASNDHTIKVWEVATGRCLRTLKKRDNNFNLLTFSDDSAYLASASTNGIIRVWKAGTGKWRHVKLGNGQTGKCLRKLGAHYGRVTAMAFSHDSARLVSVGDGDGSIKVWEVVTSKWAHFPSREATKGGCLQEFDEHHSIVSQVALSHDSALLAFATFDNTVKIWEVGTGRCLQTLEVGKTLRELSFDPTNRSHLDTEIGPIDLDLDLDPNLDPVPASNAIRMARARQDTAREYSVSPDKMWVVRDAEKLLWVPPEYRPSCLAVARSTVAMGCSSGRVIILRFQGI